MLRRDFLTAATAGAALSALPSLDLTSGVSLPDYGLFPRQEEIRRRAVDSRGVHLLWGQRSGKLRLATVIAADRIRSLGISNPRISLVSHAEEFAEFVYVEPLRILLAEENIFPDYAVFSHRSFLRNTQTSDLALIEEPDWAWFGDYYSSSAERLIEHAEESAPFVYTASSPSCRDSSYMRYVCSRLGGRDRVFDHATTWEVNPLYARESLFPYAALHSVEFFNRDFAAYKDV